MEDTVGKINEIICEALQGKYVPQQLNGNQRIIEDLCADSLQIMEICLGIGAMFEFSVNREDVYNLTTLNQIYNYVKDKMAN